MTERCGHPCGCGCRWGATCCLSCPLVECIYVDGRDTSVARIASIKRERVGRMRSEGATLEEMAVAMGTSERQVARHLAALRASEAEYISRSNVWSGQMSRAQDILKEVAAAHGITVTALVAPRRIQVLVEARHEAQYRLRELGLPLKLIAMLTGTDHTTVIHGVRRHAGRMAEMNEKQNAMSGVIRG